MDNITKETLNGIAVYAKILNDINLKFHVLIEDNTEKLFHENEQLFYEIISEIMRMIPVKKKRGSEEIVGLDSKSGILLLQMEVSFLLEDYQRIINSDINKKILQDMSIVRNKFIHEPHNINAAFYVGGKTSCSMGLYYKDRLCSVSTFKLNNIIYELNKVFDKLKTFFAEKVDKCGEHYKEYPCYVVMMNYDFRKYNKDYPMVPEWLLAEQEMEIVL